MTAWTLASARTQAVLHWADPTSVHLTRQLARLTVGRPLLLLATSRPDAGTGPERSLPVRQVTLGPLPGEAQRELRDFDEELTIERPRPLALARSDAIYRGSAAMSINIVAGPS